VRRHIVHEVEQPCFMEAAHATKYRLLKRTLYSTLSIPFNVNRLGLMQHRKEAPPGILNKTPTTHAISTTLG